MFRRLLMAGGGSGGFRPIADSVELLSSGGEVGISKVTPGAWYYPTNGLMYVGYVENTSTANANANVISWDTTANAISVGATFIGGPGFEAHAAPSVIVRETDHKVVVALSGHDAASTFQVEYSTTLTGRTATDLDSALGGSDYTYNSQVQLAGESNKLWRFYRSIAGGTGSIAYSTSTDNGVTWAAQTLLMTASAGQVLYFRVGSDWDTRIDIMTTDNDRTTSDSLYHLYYESGAWHKSDGTTITLPAVPTDATLVRASGGFATDPCGVSLDGSNVPGGVFMVYDGISSCNVWSARYRSGSWQLNRIDDTNGIVSSNRFLGGAACLESSPDTVWYSKKVGSHFELQTATTSNDGVTWTVTALETGTTTDALLPTPVHNGPTGYRVVYSKGTWTSDSSYSLTLRAAR